MALNYVYRNLRGRSWSIMQRGRVVDRVENLSAFNVELRVRPAGRRRVLKENRKNVHAFAVADGVFKMSEFMTKDDYWLKVRYNPYSYDHFFVASTGDKVSSARVVTFNWNGEMWASCINYRIGDSCD
jgi:hypothetical protein